ncbi:FtsX-like permease family protein [bacterium]|jgi:putative ABC transport system permease protein|nr:FtsX-like permease family protein [bacterium]MBT4249261.1 FtsX-like permease family protein [bacterium]MBT4927949.1 FtsX-like permease family protein [bacterium]MBT5733427.1 FtsX-like permease family protein [bacterium]MBT6017577.1 FtsX-like permease family protein [bacterium]
MLFNIAIKNLFGAKLRTSLNVFVTSISFFLVIFVSGMYDGMREYAKNITIETEVAGGTYWHREYDSMDPRTFENSHSIIPNQIKKLIDQKYAFEVLVSQASIYPNGRIMPVVMKGITPDQTIINMPTNVLNQHNDITIPVLIGSGMAKNANLKIGDSFTIRWLDADRTYDADEGTIVHIMETENFKLDLGHIWIPISKAQSMLAMKDQATYVTYDKDLEVIKDIEDWIHHDVDYMIRDMEAMIKADEPGAQVMYSILLALAAMGIFNAQVLSIFGRGKEIGTLMALGMTRSRVVTLFTLEGGLNALLSSVITLIMFGPVLFYFGREGIPLPMDYTEMGMLVAKRLIPVYSFSLIVSTTILISIIVLIVSYIPSRKITKMKPTEALRGRAAV